MSTITELPPRMQAKIHLGDSGCWLWIAALNRNGYGLARFGRVRVAHRVTYELLVGPIPGGLDLDHLCRVRNCVNPSHLEPVTRRENLRRGEHNYRDATHCQQGHPYAGDNLRISPADGGLARICRECARANDARSRERKRAAKTSA